MSLAFVLIYFPSKLTPSKLKPSKLLLHRSIEWSVL